MKHEIRIPTDRLILRTVGDIQDIVKGWNPDGSPITLEEARVHLERMRANHRRNGKGELYHLCFAITESESGDIVGWCGIDNTDSERPAPVLFYIIAESRRNMGYATEAVRALIKYGLDDLALPRIDSRTIFDNFPSKRVMEKAGMTHIHSSEEEGHVFRITN